MGAHFKGPLLRVEWEGGRCDEHKPGDLPLSSTAKNLHAHSMMIAKASMFNSKLFPAGHHRIMSCICHCRHLSNEGKMFFYVN